MKLLRYGPRGAEKPGLVHADGSIRDLSGVLSDLTGATLSDERLRAIKEIDADKLRVVPADTRLGPCVGGIGKIVCIGLNYADHAAEAGLRVPTEPLIFMKATSALSGPNDPIVLPRGAKKTDWEVELAVVIGKEAKYVEQVDAITHVAGFSIMHDVSERAFQVEREGQMTKGKSCDGFGPLGPWLVTRDEIAEPEELAIWCNVNGETMQKSTTGNLVYGVAFLISYLSQFFTLHPGDVISTGTPAGVGMGKKPPRYLRAGDVVTMGIGGLGEQRQEVVDDC